jgi:histidyl-tRNA synthetase
MFEYTDVFLRNIGESTDIVSKEMYTFVDKGGRSLTLKPEGTASVARSFVQHSLHDAGLPVRLYYITPVFRYENPQKGRYRQHHQFGVEFFGDNSVYMDFEVVNLAHELLTALGLNNVQLHLNSIGCNVCRPDYVNALKDYANTHIKDLCTQCVTRLSKNPLRILDCKVQSCRQVLQCAPTVDKHICNQCNEHQCTLTKLLDYANISYNINPYIVRGLDYYSRTVFEFVSNSDVLGNQATICGGGRYEELVHNMGGKPTSCVGFGMGIERLIATMTAQNLSFGEIARPLLSLIYASTNYIEDCMQLAWQLRKHISVDIDYTHKSLKSQLRRADKLRSKYAIVIGEQELTTNQVVLKHLDTRQEVSIDINQLLLSPTIFLQS